MDEAKKKYEEKWKKKYSRELIERNIYMEEKKSKSYTKKKK